MLGFRGDSQALRATPSAGSHRQRGSNIVSGPSTVTLLSRRHVRPKGRAPMEAACGSVTRPRLRLAAGPPGGGGKFLPLPPVGQLGLHHHSAPGDALPVYRTGCLSRDPRNGILTSTRKRVSEFSLARAASWGPRLPLFRSWEPSTFRAEMERALRRQPQPRPPAQTSNMLYVRPNRATKKKRKKHRPTRRLHLPSG